MNGNEHDQPLAVVTPQPPFREAPRPRFFVIIGALLLSIIGLWNQDQITVLINKTTSQICSDQTNMAAPYSTTAPPIVSQAPPIQEPASPPQPASPASPSPPPTVKAPAVVAEVAPIPPKVVIPYTTEVAPNTIVKVLEVRKFYLRGVQADGKIVLRTGGNLTWRVNNPGKIAYGDFAKTMGSLGTGSDGKTAIFPTYEMGRKAMENYLFTDAGGGYQLHEIGYIFVPDVLKFIGKETGIPQNILLKDMNQEQRNKLMDAIQKVEGYIEGKVIVFADENAWTKNGW